MIWLERQIFSLSVSQWLNTSFWGNNLTDYLWAFVWLIVSLLCLKVLQSLVMSRLKRLAKKTSTPIDDTLLKIVTSIKPPLYFFIAFYFAVNTLELSNKIQVILNGVFIGWLIFQAISTIQILIDIIAAKYIDKQEDQGETKLAVDTLKLIAKIGLWVMGGLLILSNLGIQVTSLVAGLGIGGIAVALAVQNVLGDLLSSFSIYFDKPFKIGDFIIVGDKMGTVEKIGIKTTRIKALQGEEIVIPNAKLTSEVIQNFKKMKKRRVSFSFGVTYETPSKRLEDIPKLIEKIVSNQEFADFDRAHFKEFGDSALIFEVVYHVTTSEYNLYMDTQQAINLELLDSLSKFNVSMAYPTTTVHVVK